MAKVRRGDLLRDAVEEKAARIRSCGGTGAAAHLVSVGTEGNGLELFDGVLAFDLRRHLGLDVCHEGLTCAVA
eukprot:11351308-Karenia_brevis.AAC.1